MGQDYRIDSVIITVFWKEDEGVQEQQRIIKALKNLTGINTEDAKGSIEKTNAIGFNEKKIIIYTARIQRRKVVKSFISNLKKNLGSTQMRLICSQIDSRLDKEQRFYMRLRKDKLLNGEYQVTDSGSCFHIKISVITYPKDCRKALSAVMDIFGCDSAK